jgi:hypothetical protein
MPSIRDFIDPGGRMLARRLDQLCLTLEGLGTRLRATIANAIGETIGGLVRDTALRVLDETTQCLPAFQPMLSPLSRTAPNTLAPEGFGPEERDYWMDAADAHSEPGLEDPPVPTLSERLPTALSAGLQAASWWLRRWSGRGRTLTTLAVGVLATGLAFVGGPLVVAVLGLAGTATQFNSLADAIGTGLAAFSDFNSA